jgi:hypothetical protein
MELLTIIHNHGRLVLRDVTLHPYVYKRENGNALTWHVAEGVVVDGGETARLFHATAHREYPKGETMRWDLYGMADRIRDGVVNMQCCG